MVAFSPTLAVFTTVLLLGGASAEEVPNSSACQRIASFLTSNNFISRAGGCVGNPKRKRCCDEIQSIFDSERDAASCFCNPAYFSELLSQLEAAPGLASDAYVNMLKECVFRLHGYKSCVGLSGRDGLEPIFQKTSHRHLLGSFHRHHHHYHHHHHHHYHYHHYPHPYRWPFFSHPPPPPAIPATPTAGSVPEHGASECTIPEILVAGDPDLTILARLLMVADLDDDDSDDDQLVATIFGPTDAAFRVLLANLGISVDAFTSAEFIPITGKLLRYLLVPGVAVTSDQLSDGQVLQPMLEGEVLTVDLGYGVHIVPSGGPRPATVVEADIKACQVVIHKVDGVLIPKSLESQLMEAVRIQG